MESDEQSLILFKALAELLSPVDVDPLQQYVVSKNGNTTIYNIPVNVFMNFDLKEIKKHYSHFDWLYDFRWSYYKVTTELRDNRLKLDE